MKNRIVLLSFLSVCLLVVAGCASFDQEDLRIGLILPLTGEKGVDGKQIERGARLALAEIEKETPSSTKIPKLQVFDDYGRSEFTASCVNRFAVDGTAMSIVGDVSSKSLRDFALLYEFPILSPTDTGTNYFEDNKYVLFTNFNDDQQAKAMAYFLFYDQKINNVGIMLNLDLDSLHDREVGRFFGMHFNDIGGSVLHSVAFESSKDNFEEPLKEIIRLNPGAIFVPSSGAYGGKIVKKARELGYSGIILGGADWNDNEFLSNCGEAIGNVAFSSAFPLENKSAAQEKFMTEFKKLYGYEPGLNEALGYDAMRIAFYSVNNASSRRDIVERFKSLRAYDGATGMLRTLKTGGVSRNIYINTVVKDNNNKYQFKLQKTINKELIDSPESPFKRSKNNILAE